MRDTEFIVETRRIREHMLNGRTSEALRDSQVLIAKKELPGFVRRYLEFIVKRLQTKDNKTQGDISYSIDTAKSEPDSKWDASEHELRTWTRTDQLQNRLIGEALQLKGIDINSISFKTGEKLLIRAFTTRRIRGFRVRGEARLRQRSGSEIKVLHFYNKGGGSSLLIVIEAPRESGENLMVEYTDETSGEDVSLATFTGNLTHYSAIALQCKYAQAPVFITLREANRLLLRAEEREARNRQGCTQDVNTQRTAHCLITLDETDCTIEIKHPDGRITTIENVVISELAEYLSRLSTPCKVLVVDSRLVLREDYETFCFGCRELNKTDSISRIRILNHLIEDTGTSELFALHFSGVAGVHAGQLTDKDLHNKAWYGRANSFVRILESEEGPRDRNEMQRIFDAYYGLETFSCSASEYIGIEYKAPLPREMHRSYQHALSTCISSRDRVESRVNEWIESEVGIVDLEYTGESANTGILSGTRNKEDECRYMNTERIIDTRRVLRFAALGPFRYLCFDNASHEEDRAHISRGLELMAKIPLCCSVTPIALASDKRMKVASGFYIEEYSSGRYNLVPNILPIELCRNPMQVQIAPMEGSLFCADFIRTSLCHFPESCSISEFRLLLGLHAQRDGMKNIVYLDTSLRRTPKFEYKQWRIPDRLSSVIANSEMRATDSTLIPVRRYING